MKHKHIMIGITGSIAAYKSAEIVSRLKQDEAEVRVVMTCNAFNFVGPATFTGLTKQPVYSNSFPKNGLLIPHIELANWADILVIVPATANIIGKIAGGISDDLLTSLVIAATVPVVIAPAMNDKMYNNMIVQENIHKLQDAGYRIIEAETGHLACGEKGKGRLADTNVILDVIKDYLTDK